jgi:hypothetical protein
MRRELTINEQNLRHMKMLMNSRAIRSSKLIKLHKTVTKTGLCSKDMIVSAPGDIERDQFDPGEIPFIF